MVFKKYDKILKIVVIGIVLVAITSIVITDNKPVCFDDFANDEAGYAEYLASADKWENDFYDSHPEATVKDWAEARYQFWLDNDCEGSLQRVEKVRSIR